MRRLIISVFKCSLLINNLTTLIHVLITVLFVLFITFFSSCAKDLKEMRIGVILPLTGDYANLGERLENIFELFPILKERQKQKAGILSTGEQQMLALGRALMLRPELLLLDEPSLGLSPNYVDDVFEKIKEINEDGTTIVLVEQNARMALEYANRGYVFEIGEIALEDSGKNLLENDEVRKSFLGE